jgi:small conductance mechanosensitive channel
MQQYYKNAIEWLGTNGIKILIIVVITLIILKIARKLVNRAFSVKADQINSETQKRVDTLRRIFRQVITVAIVVIAGVMVLGEMGIEIGPILAAAGVAGVALGFGAQHLVKDVISGLFILMDDQIRVGDVVDIGGKAGLVERVNLRMTILRDLAGNVHYVRNGEITVVTNMTKDYSRYVFEIGVAYRENVDEVIKVVQEIDEEMRSDPQYANDILSPIEILGLDKFADSAVIIKARTTTKPIKQWAVGREFNRRMKKRFDEENIEIPFPHTTLYMGQEKDGSAPPLNLNVNKEN